MLNTLPLSYTLYNPHDTESQFCFTPSPITEEHFDIVFSAFGAQQTQANFDPFTTDLHKMHKVAVPNPRNYGEAYFFTNGYPVTHVPVALARQIWMELVQNGWAAE